ncbi:MAG: KR domain-containing protein [Pseudomonadota bacterium]
MFLEVGPGNVLGSLTRQNPNVSPNVVLSSMRHPEQVVSDTTYLRSTQGRIWACGFPIEETELSGPGDHRRLPLPTYAFQHQSYWIEPGKGSASVTESSGLLEKIDDVDRWIRTSVWVQQGVLAEVSSDKHTWLVFLDHAGFGDHLVEQLRKQGHRVVTVTESDAYFKLSNDAYLLSPEHGQDGYQTLINDLEASGMFPERLLHLWLVTDDEQFRPGSSFFHRNMEFGFYSLFFFGKAMADAGLMDRELQVLTFTNGMQQVEGESLPYPEKATVLGATRVLPREFPGIECRVIDLDFEHPANEKQRESDISDSIERLSAQMLVEVAAPGGSGTYAYRDGVRWEQRFDHFRPDDYENQERLRPQGCYLITGGLGGIGHVIAMHLASTVNAELVLVNRTPLPDRDEWDDWLRQHIHDDRISRNIRNVRALEQAGAHVTVEAGDVTDVIRMRQIVEDVERSGRQINGVIHAAGTVNDNLIQLKQQHEIEDTFAPKVYGTLVLDELFTGKPLDFFVLFSSTSTAIAPVGQIDYVAANAFINAYAQQRNTDEPGLTLALNWGVWNEVGMAAETAASMGYAGDNGAQSNESACDGDFYDRRLTRVADGMDHHVLQASISSAKHWILDQHRTRAGQALWPGTGYLELIREALQEVSETGPFQVQELTFLEALYVPDGIELDIRVKLSQTLYGYDFQLQSLAGEDADGQDWVVHAEARIALNEESIADIDPFPEEEIGPVGWRERSVIDSAQEVHLNFGEQWKVLRAIEDQGDVSFGFCYLDAPHSEVLAVHRLHPGMLDIATGFAMHLIPGYEAGPTRLWVPVAYRNFSFVRPLTQSVVSRIRRVVAGESDDFASFEIDLFDDAGNLLVSIERLTLRQLSETIDFDADNGPRMTEREATGGSGTPCFRQLSAAELAFQHNLSQGIRPVEGCATFSNVLNLAAQPELIVSSLPLEPLIIEAGNAALELHQQDDDGTKFARPDLDNEYVEPRDDIDKTLVGFWEELLGVDGVGIEDNFFDLGGHSLVAVRLFSKIQQKYEVDYAISVLFEAPTISQCADMIRESVGDTAGAGTDDGAGSSTERTTRYTHLVPMHSTKSDHETPFFFVAGMFGNVLNLRHLAQLIGSDRPFYGLQARGLYGDHSPHETFEEMAADYIAEMMTVQSGGPYLLGGFSGGGITAYEICRQLLQAGHEVKRLVMLDTPLPHEEPLSTVDKFAIQWQNIQRGGVAYFREWAVKRVEWELRKMRGQTLKSSDGEGPTEFQNKSIEEAFRRALGKYQLESLPIDLKLFRPRQIDAYQLSDGRTANAKKVINRGDNRWTPYVSDLEIFEMPGDHDSMVLEPNVRVLANKLAECLK